MIKKEQIIEVLETNTEWLSDNDIILKSDFNKVADEIVKLFATPDMEEDSRNKETAKLGIGAVSDMLPLTKEHQCFERGHAFYLVCEIDNGRSKYGEHKCSRCGHVEPFQYDYGIW